MTPTIIKIVEQSYNKLEDVRNQYIKLYGEISTWDLVQYSYLLNSDIEILALLDSHEVNVSKEALDYGITIGLIMVRNEVRSMFYQKYDTLDLDMDVKIEMYNTIYEYALEFWMNGPSAFNVK